jgi:hypothetical protein
MNAVHLAVPSPYGYSRRTDVASQQKAPKSSGLSLFHCIRLSNDYCCAEAT